MQTEPAADRVDEVDEHPERADVHERGHGRDDGLGQRPLSDGVIILMAVMACSLMTVMASSYSWQR
jgi:hypothetical protein